MMLGVLTPGGLSRCLSLTISAVRIDLILAVTGLNASRGQEGYVNVSYYPVMTTDPDFKCGTTG
jgi:hypothetical protein